MISIEEEVSFSKIEKTVAEREEEVRILAKNIIHLFLMLMKILLR